MEVDTGPLANLVRWHRQNEPSLIASLGDAPDVSAAMSTAQRREQLGLYESPIIVLATARRASVTTQAVRFLIETDENLFWPQAAALVRGLFEDAVVSWWISLNPSLSYQLKEHHLATRIVANALSAAHDGSAFHVDPEAAVRSIDWLRSHDVDKPFGMWAHKSWTSGNPLNKLCKPVIQAFRSQGATSRADELASWEQLVHRTNNCFVHHSPIALEEWLVIDPMEPLALRSDYPLWTTRVLPMAYFSFALQIRAALYVTGTAGHHEIIPFAPGLEDVAPNLAVDFERMAIEGSEDYCLSPASVGALSEISSATRRSL